MYHKSEKVLSVQIMESECRSIFRDVTETNTVIPLLVKGSWAPIIEAFAELTSISMCALFGLCGSSYVILSVPQLVKILYGI